MLRIIFLTALLCPLVVFCQESIASLISKKETPTIQKEISPLKIGDKMPDLVIDNIINATYRSTKLSSFKGKITLIEFWHTTCGSCIAAMHKVEPLQKKYANEFQVLAVTIEDEKYVHAWVKNKKIAGEFTFPIVTLDKQLSKLFPHRYIPHYVWLDAEQKIIAITDSKSVTEQNIQAIINGDIPKMKIKSDNVVFDRKISLYDNLGETVQDHIIFQSVLTRAIPGISGYSGEELSKDSIRRRYYLINLPLMSLCQTATGTYLMPRNRILTETEEINKMLDEGFAYELTYPINTTKNERRMYLKLDIEKYLAIKIDLTKRKVSCWALRLVNNDSSKLMTNGGTPRGEMGDRNKPEKYMINFPMSQFVQSLNPISINMPITVDETGIKGGIDMIFKGSLTDWSNVQANIARYNLQLVPIEKEMEVLVVSSAKRRITIE